ncbi:hypothetical protein V5799_006520 [Amblyomma americanum]|uniref:Nlr family card domain protein n=1 Tax=Amblyomma americanum TaxID=6943 RepID=A0AAQ4DW62_AMBAM
MAMKRLSYGNGQVPSPNGKRRKIALENESQTTSALTTESLSADMGIFYAALKVLGVPPANSCYSRTPIAFDTTCTAGPNRTCRLVRHLSVWNELLWQCGLQLRESTEELGRLCLTAVDSQRELTDGDYEFRRQAAALVLHLMTVHRCVAEVHVNESLLAARYTVTCLAVRSASPELRRLVVRSIPRYGDHRERCIIVFGQVLKFMTQLEEFSYQDRWCPSAIVGPMCTLLRRSHCLRSLDFAAVAHLHAELSADFVQALKSNSTITELILSTTVMDLAEPATRQSMADYLCHSRKLRKLVYVAASMYQVDAFEVRSLVEPLFDNEALEELHLSISALSAEGIEVIAELVARNKSLKMLFVRWSVKVESCRCPCVVEERLSTKEDNQATARERDERAPYPGVDEGEYSSWARAFAVNQTLQELALDMSRLNSAECEAFFRALPASGTLRTVCVMGLPIIVPRQMLTVVRDAGTTLRSVHIENAHDSTTEVETLNKLEQVWENNVHSGDRTRIHEALHVTRGFLHVTHLCLFLDTLDFDLTSHVSLAQYIQETRTLRGLALVGDGYVERNDQAEVTLVQALKANKSIRSLGFTDLPSCTEALHLLASVVRRSQSLCEFAFLSSKSESAQFFLACLAPGFSTNHVLVRLDLPGISDMSFERFHVVDVVRRNAMLVARAARFVTGASKERYCAEAFEPVAKSSALVEMVRRLGCLSNDSDAESMVRETWRGLEEMNDFMRAAGVVRNSIVCWKRGDGRLQLDDLNSDCLRLIRQFLTLADVAVASPDSDLVH